MDYNLTYWVHKESRRLIPVNEAERGLFCNCICPECGGDLVKKDRWEFRKRRAHFAHYRNTEFCTEEKAYESTLHKLWKQILFEEKAIFLPEYSVFSDLYWIILPSKKTWFKTVEVEERIDDLIPDIIWNNQSGSLWIELVNTHYINSINSDKLQKIRDRWIECIEIDLKWQDLDTLKEFLLNSDENRYWINSPRNQFEVEELHKQKIKEKEEKHARDRKEREEKLADFKKRINDWKNEGYTEYYLHPNYNRPIQCPKYKKDLENIRSWRLYMHPIIRDIIDKKKGWDWNLYCNWIIYWRGLHFIYYKGSKYQIYDNPLENNPALLYAGLKRIEEIREISCYECEYNKINTANFSHELKDGISICSIWFRYK